MEKHDKQSVQDQFSLLAHWATHRSSQLHNLCNNEWKMVSNTPARKIHPLLSMKGCVTGDAYIRSIVVK